MIGSLGFPALGYPWSECPPGQEWSWGSGGSDGAQAGCQNTNFDSTLELLASKLFDGASFAGDTRAQKLQYGYFATKAILDKYDAPPFSYEEGESMMQSIGATINENMSAVVEQMKSYASISEMPVQSLSLQSRYEVAIRLAKFLWQYASDLVTFYVNEADRALQKYDPRYTNEFFNRDVTYRLYIYQAIIEMDRRGAFGPPKSSFQGPEAAPLITPQVAGAAILVSILVIAWIGWSWVQSSQEVVKSMAQKCIETKDPILCKTAESMAQTASPNATIVDHAVNVVVGGALIYALIVYGIPALAEKIPALMKKT